MSTRYGRQSDEGHYEYHDTKESMREAELRETFKANRLFWAWVGLFTGAVLTYLAFDKFGADLPKWARFTGFIAGAGIGSATFYVLARVLLAVVGVTIIVAFLYAVVALIWNFV